MGTVQALSFLLIMMPVLAIVTAAGNVSSNAFGYVCSGMMSARFLGNGSAGSNTSKVEITTTIGWVLGHGPCGPGCSEADVGRPTHKRRLHIIQEERNPAIFGNWSTEFEDGVGPYVHLDSITDTVNRYMQGRIAAVSRTLQWEQEIIHFQIDIQSSARYTDVALQGLMWRPYNLNDPHTSLDRSHFHLQTKVHPGIRNDTGTANRSPVVLYQPIYRVPLDRVTQIRLTSADQDGDFVTCRQARNVETAGIGSIPNTSISKDCVVTISAMSSDGFTNGSWGMVAIALEDFTRNPITLRGTHLKAFDAHALSASMLNFMVWVVAGTWEPEFVLPTPVSQHVYTVYTGSDLSIPLAAKPSDNSPPSTKITQFRIVSLPEHPVLVSTAVLDPQRLAERVVTSTLQWRTSDSDAGDVFVLQVVAIDSDGLESKDRSFSIEVKGLAQEQQTEKFGANPYFPFFPAPGSVQCLVNTTCVVPIYVKEGISSHTVVSVETVAAQTDVGDVTSGGLEPVTVKGTHVYRQNVQLTGSDIGNRTLCLVATDNHGFRTERCLDVLIYPEDPCSDNPCHHGQCVSMWDSFKCLCPASKTGPLCTEWLDPCSSGPCLNGGVCYSREPLAVHACRCTPGFHGERDCATNIDDCQSNPCQNGSTCVDEVNGFHCLCEAGFTGPRCTTDPCSENPCHNATCVSMSDSFKCLCPPSKTGPLCTEWLDPCLSGPCMNGAICLSREPMPTPGCRCPPGYGDRVCATNIDDCQGNPCQNGGTCVDEVNGFHCLCEAGFTGPICTTVLNPCLSGPCMHGGTCHYRLPLPYHVCTCPAGYSGNFDCATNIDDCQGNPCQNGGTCVDEVNGFHCLCEAGFTGPNCTTELSGLFWSSHSLPDDTVLHACPGDSVAFDWWLMTNNHTDLDIQWFYEGRSSEIVAVESHGQFVVLPAFSGRAHRSGGVSETGMVLDHVTAGDSGNYSVYVTGVDAVTRQLSRVERSASLQILAGLEGGCSN